MDIVRVTSQLTPEEVEDGYRQGMFPMAEAELGLVTWHRPRRRGIIPLESFHIPRSLGRRQRRGDHTVTVDRDFAGVMAGCASRDPTWISDEFITVYSELHRKGNAHSVEVWMGDRLVGGIYGVHLGGAFFAESKFHRERDMSKVALAELALRLRERGFLLLEVQYLTRHLEQFGAIEIPHRDYLRRLEKAIAVERRLL